MKRDFYHPPEPQTGKQYWRSVNELADTAEFREWLERLRRGEPGAAGRFWLERMSSARSSLGPIYEECGMDYSGQVPLLRNCDAAAQRGDSSHCNDR